MKNITKQWFTNKRLKQLLLLAIILLLVFSPGDVINAQHFQAVKKCLFVNPPHSVKLSNAESNDLKSLGNSIFVSGLIFDKISADSLSPGTMANYNLLILPAVSAKSLSPKQLTVVDEALMSGVNLLFFGPSQLQEKLGIKLQENPISINQIRDFQFPDLTLYWTTVSNVRPIESAGKNYKILCVDDSTEYPIGISSTLGKGRFVYFSTYFDPNTTKGYSRFPFLIETIRSEFDIKALAELKTMEMYFDPGMRDTVKIENLVQFWRKNKIKRIHAGGWYYDSDYDYTKLIKACHENGILVYCWFEPPMISQTFWDKHPEWREKTATNRDAAIDWRLLMNLADTNCRNQIFKEWNTFQMSHDFDGVNFAELYFDPSPVGPNLPENFTPMNLQVRNQFKKQSGFDPVELFDANGPHYWKSHPADWKTFANYRKDLCYQLKDQYLGFLYKIKEQKKDFEVMLTVLDVSLTPELSDFIAEDTQNTLKLYKKYGATMQIEDPSNCWGLTPERYFKMGEFYRKYIKGPNKLLFDCNVVGSHEKGEGGFPSEKPSGEEIRQITYNMSTHINRPVFYSEDAINKNDWLNISNTLARDTKIKAIKPTVWSLTANNTVLIHTGLTSADLKLDGRNWYAGEGDAVIIPKGIHTLETNQNESFKPFTGIISISGELFSADFRKDEIGFSYTEDFVPCYVTIGRQPVSIYIDDKKTDCPVYQNTDSEFTLKLPAGKHKVKIR